MPKSPAQKVIDRAFSQFRKNEHPNEAEDYVFGLYAADRILRQMILDDGELESGIVDGTGDGGVDAFYTFLNGALVQDDHSALQSEKEASKSVGNSPSIEVVLIQAKNRDSWEEAVVEKLYENVTHLLDDSVGEVELLEDYKEELVTQVMIFRKLSENLTMKFPKFTFRVKYVTRAIETNMTNTIKKKGKNLEVLIEGFLTPDSFVKCDFIGADALYKLEGEAVSRPATLKFRNTIIREEGAYLGIADINEYLKFVRNEHDELRGDLFESNVRDFEGTNSVNKAIKKTLSTAGDTEFWWQNNGITILGRRVNAPTQTLTIEQPLIVNGLQTTQVLNDAEEEGHLDESRRAEGILVRVIESDDDSVRDTVIAGTNRQTRVAGPALYATDEIQVDIERFFLASDWFYERRKNKYKNQGKPAARRVTIGGLAQAVMVLELGQPDVARARPSTLLNGQYAKVFNKKIGMEAYLVAAKMLAEVSSFLRTAKAKEVVDDYSNMRFYLLVSAAMAKVNAKKFTSLKFQENWTRLSKGLGEDLLLSSLKKTNELFESYEKKNPTMTRDSISKSSDFRTWFLDSLDC